MARITYDIVGGGDYGDDPINRKTTTTLPSVGGQPTTVAVDHVPAPVPTNRPGTSDPGSNSPPQPVSRTTDPTAPQRLISQESGIAPFETFFTQFVLEAQPVYNFWEKDEETSTHQRGNLDPDDLPRYVHLTWLMAPDLKDPDAFRKRALSDDPTAKTVFTQLTPFGLGANAVVGTVAAGLPFTPGYLQPDHFQQNAQAVANGDIFSGIAEAVVAVPTATMVPPPAPSSSLVDEDEYLADYTRWQGIPFTEFNSALWRRTSTVYGIQQALGGLRLSPAGSLLFNNLFSGQFGLSPYGGNSINIQSVSPVGAAISVQASTAQVDRTYMQPRILELADPLLSDRGPALKPAQTLKAKLIHTNFAGLLDPTRATAATQAHHGESMVALAPMAGNLAAYSAAGMQHYTREISIPNFPAPDTLKPLEYIGYVIEKWEQIDGSFELVDTFYIPGREFTDYIDAGVKYGSAYRYRIKAIVRWSRERGLGVLGTDPTTNPNPGSHINSLTPNDVSYFESEWGHDWAYAQVIDREPPNPPDELIIQPHSEPDPATGNPFVIVTFRVPYNPQRDINNMTLYRKVQDADGNDVTGWIQLQEFTEDLNDPTRQGTRHLYLTSYQHEQDDITGTKFIATNTEVTQNFVEYGPTTARFEDHDVEYYGKSSQYRYVYAAICYTRHGEESVLSEQIGCRLNPDWKKNGEYPLDFVSCAGVNMDYDTGLFGTWPERRMRSEIIFTPDLKNNLPAVISVGGQERRAKKLISNSHYVLRVESLDTGQHVDVPVDLTLQNLPEQVSTQPLPAMVPAPG